MKIMIFSDTHCTTNYNQRLLEKMVTEIQHHDKVIINGDFWDGIVITFDEFIKSKWSRLFPILKEKKTVYLYGNHDEQQYCDDRVSLFSIEQDTIYSTKTKNKNITIMHGHQVIGDYNSKMPWVNHKLDPIYKKFFQIYQAGSGTLESIASALYQADKKISHYSFVRKFPKMFPIKKNEFYIFGHTHIPTYNQELGFANPGAPTKKIFRYCTIDTTTDQIELHEKKY